MSNLALQEVMAGLLFQQADGCKHNLNSGGNSEQFSGRR